MLYCFVRDYDSHTYLIPVTMRSLFEERLEGITDDNDNLNFDDLFGKYMLGVSLYNIAFENPKSMVE